MEELHRRKCRSDLATWCRHALAPLGQKPARHHLALIERLERVASGEIDRLMVLMPPGSAKSTYASVLFPAWFLAQTSHSSIIGASHTASLAEDFSRRVLSVVRDNPRELGYGLTRESAELWTTTNGGRYRAAGVGGPITGQRADLFIIDDPVKSREDANSETMREKAYGWYRADVMTRLKPGARMVLIMTRWHEDDLGGRLLLDAQAGGDQWDVLKLPAIAEGGSDPLGRLDGDALWPEWEDETALARKRAAIGELEYAALFQQRPRVAEGSLFKIAMLGTVEARPAGGRLVRAWDLAATEQVGSRNPDWTAGVLLRRDDEGRFTVLDVVRLRGGPEEVEAAIVNAAAQDGRAVTIGLPQDPGQAGKQQVAYLTRKLLGYIVQSSPETGDKTTRAAPVAAQVNVGNVALVRASWNRPLIDEMTDFPNGTKDDQVDALSRAFGMLTSLPVPARRADIRIMGR